MHAAVFWRALGESEALQPVGGPALLVPDQLPLKDFTSHHIITQAVIYLFISFVPSPERSEGVF